MSNKQKWEAIGNLVRTVREPNGHGGWLVAECQHKEDGALVAAAPELYEAIEALLEFGTNETHNRGAWAVDKARAALAKARGEQS